MPTSSRGMPEKLVATPWTMDKRPEPAASVGAAVQPPPQQQAQPNAASLVGALLRSPPPAHSGYGPSASGHLLYGSGQLTAAHPAAMIASIPPGMFGVAASSHLGDQKTKISSRLNAGSDGLSAHTGSAGREADATAPHKARHAAPEPAACTTVRVAVNGDIQRRPVGSGSREAHTASVATTPSHPGVATAAVLSAAAATKGDAPPALPKFAASSIALPPLNATKTLVAVGGKGLVEASTLVASTASQAVHVSHGGPRTQARAVEQTRGPVTEAVASARAAGSPASPVSHAGQVGSRSRSPAVVAVGRVPSPAAAAAMLSGHGVESTLASPMLLHRSGGIAAAAAAASRTDTPPQPARPGSTFKIAPAGQPQALARDPGLGVGAAAAVSLTSTVRAEAAADVTLLARRGSPVIVTADPGLLARSARRPASAGPQTTVPVRQSPAGRAMATLGVPHAVEVSGLHRPLSPLVTGRVIVCPHPSSLVATTAAVPAAAAAAAGASPRPSERLSNGGSAAPVDYSSRATMRPASSGPVPSTVAASLRSAAATPVVASRSVPDQARPVSAPAAVVVSAGLARSVLDRKPMESATAVATGGTMSPYGRLHGLPWSSDTREAKHVTPGNAAHNSSSARGLPFSQLGKPVLATEQAVASHVARRGALLLPHSRRTTPAVTSAADVVAMQPFNQRLKTLANFPLSSSQLTSTSRMRLLAAHRSRAGCVVSSAKSLELLRRTVQKLLNAEVDAILRKHITPFLRPAYDNLCTNSSEADGQAAAIASFEQSLASVCYHVLDEAKKMYAPAAAGHAARSATPDGSDGASDAGSTTAERRTPRLMFSHLKRRYSDSDSEASAATVKKRRGRPPGSGSANAAARLQRPAEPIKRDAAKWNPDRIKPDQLFVMGARANKALGLGATRGRLYIKHPEVFKYTGDQDDKLWLFEAHLLPATGGKAYMLLVEDVRELAEKDEYKNSGSLMLHELKGFTIPDWMQVKVKAQMAALCAEGSRRRPANAGLLADAASMSSGGAGEDGASITATGGMESSKATPSSLGESPYPADQVADDDDKEEQSVPFLTSGEVSGSSETEEEDDVGRDDEDDDDEPPPLSAPFTMTEPASTIGDHH